MRKAEIYAAQFTKTNQLHLLAQPGNTVKVRFSYK